MSELSQKQNLIQQFLSPGSGKFTIKADGKGVVVLTNDSTKEAAILKLK
jgi:hypothetical protein